MSNLILTSPQASWQGANGCYLHRDTDVADANRGVAELNQMLRETEALDVRLVRADPSTQDFGSAVHVLAASPSAVVEITRVLTKWLLRNQYSLTVDIAEGTQSLLDAASFDPDLAKRIREVGSGSRLNRVINASGNVVTSTGAVSGIAPLEPWPKPKHSRK